MQKRFHTRQVTFRQLEVFKKVAEESSITVAAKNLHLAQPTVSTQINNLSESLGVTLFEKIGKQLYLTQMGGEILRTTRTVFDAIDGLEMTLAQIEGLSYGQLRISVVTTAKYLIPRYLGEFCEKHPGISPELHVGNRAEIIQRLKQNLDDVYVFSNPPNEIDIHSDLITENPLVIVGQPQHKSTPRKKLPWSSLDKQRFLMREKGSGTRFAVERHLEKLGLKMHRYITIASNEAIKESVMAGLGIGILSRHALAHMASGNLVELNIEGFPISNSWYWVVPKGKQLSPSVTAFKSFVADRINSA